MEAEVLVVTSSLEDLPRVLDFVRQACLNAGLDEDAVFACELAADEACTNIIEHAYHGRPDGEIRVSCLRTRQGFTVEFRDRGTSFDPSQVAAPNLSGTLFERDVGGLGLHFMRSLMDEVHFQFDEKEGNTLTMTRRFT